MNRRWTLPTKCARSWAIFATILLFAHVAHAQHITVGDAGFAYPVSAVHDATADVYLVSNVHGAPFERDNDGFVSKVAPDGNVLDAHWIDPARDAIELNSPTGMAVAGNTLYVADIDTVRLFDRTSGAFEKSIHIPEATLLMDIAASPDGGVFVTNIAPDDPERNAIFHLRDERVETIARGAELRTPTGLVALEADELLVVTNSSPAFLLGVTAGSVEIVREFPVYNLQGLVVLPNGDRVVSHWGASPLLRFAPGDHDLVPLLSGSHSLGDVGYDSLRHRLLVADFREDTVLLLDLEPQAHRDPR